jgi:molybdate transport system substrate-binding protein
MRNLFIRIGTVAAGVALLAGCGSGSGGGGGTSSTSTSTATSGPLVVLAASSLQTAFTQYGQKFDGGKTRFSFAGSDQLAAQIRQGVKPDVFASANTKLPDALYAAGLVQKPTVFAGNRLVLAVPANSTKITSLSDVERPGVTLAIGSASVPIGSYTHSVLDNLPSSASKQILANVRSEEPDVKGIVGKLSQGAVDAGFVYITDVTAAKGALKAIELPASLNASAAYGVAVVTGAKHPAEAKRFIAGLVSGPGQDALHAAGFEPPPT